MDFSYSEEQIEVQRLAHQLLSDYTNNEHLREIEAGEELFDAKLWTLLGETGLSGVALPESYGGMDMGFESLCLLVEEVGCMMAPVPVIPTLASAALPIATFGTDEQKQRLLPGVAAGGTILSTAFVEAGNEDSCAPALTAVRGELGWVLNGGKICVPYANHADRILLSAQSEAGLLLLLLDPKQPGVVLSRQDVTAGELQFELRLRDVRVADADLFAGPGEDSMRVMRWTVERTTAAYCALAVGIVDAATRLTARYTAEREQFGVKIATFQAVGQRAANCYIDTECLRAVTQQAISLLDQGRDARREVQIAKIWAGDATHRVSHAAQHLHGGIGIDKDYSLFRYCLWSKQLELTLGSSAQLLAKLGRSIAKEFSSKSY